MPFSVRVEAPAGASTRTLNGLCKKRGHRFNRRPEVSMFRVGIGHDTHRLGPNRPLILGGVKIEHPRGMIAHSDGDVVLHALTDAMLGAAGLGDIGDAFPDNDPKYKDCDSRLFI